MLCAHKTGTLPKEGIRSTGMLVLFAALHACLLWEYVEIFEGTNYFFLIWQKVDFLQNSLTQTRKNPPIPFGWFCCWFPSWIFWNNSILLLRMLLGSSFLWSLNPTRKDVVLLSCLAKPSAAIVLIGWHWYYIAWRDLVTSASRSNSIIFMGVAQLCIILVLISCTDISNLPLPLAYTCWHLIALFIF